MTKFKHINDAGAYLWWLLVEWRKTQLAEEKKEFTRNFIVYFLSIIIIVLIAAEIYILINKN